LLDAGRAVSIDVMLEKCHQTAVLIAGGVVVVGNQYRSTYSTAQGRQFPDAASPLLTERTLFDTASLTKVLATGTGHYETARTGKDQSAPIRSPAGFPEFEDTDPRGYYYPSTCITHTSGLDDVDIPKDDPLRKSDSQNHGTAQRQPPGNRFRYCRH